MNIYEATTRSVDENLFLRKKGRTDEWTLYVAFGSVYRKQNGIEIELDARDCMGNDWYLIDNNGDEVT